MTRFVGIIFTWLRDPGFKERTWHCTKISHLFVYFFEKFTSNGLPTGFVLLLMLYSAVSRPVSFPSWQNQLRQRIILILVLNKKYTYGFVPLAVAISNTRTNRDLPFEILSLIITLNEPFRITIILRILLLRRLHVYLYSDF